MSESICEKCACPLVDGCDGQGHIYVDDLTRRQCVNLYARQLGQHLGKEIASVKHVTESPLFGKEDLTQKDILIRCTWRGLLPHLKWALGCKGLLFFFKIVTDERIRSVFVGGEAYRARSSRLRDDLDTNNTLSDLVLGPDLLIVKLGYLGYKNQAAPGALKESLLIRKEANRATWVLLDEEHPWIHSHSADVEYFVEQNYREIVIETPPDIHPDEPESDIVVDEEEDEKPSYKPVPRKPLVEKLEQTIETDMLLPGEGRKKKRKW